MAFAATDYLRGAQLISGENNVFLWCMVPVEAVIIWLLFLYEW